MNITGAVLTFAACVAVLILPRRHALLAYVSAVFYITQGQAVDIGGINFMAIRFVEVSAFLRVVIRGEWRRLSLDATDRILPIFFLTYVLVFCIREGMFSTYEIGVSIDALLVFFTFRTMIRGSDDVRWFLNRTIALLVPLAALMLVEASTGRNLFASMGGVPEFPVYREGHFRSQGSFRHAITAGSVGATYFPLFVALFFQGLNFFYCLLGIAACTAIVISSYSSGPLMSLIVALICWCCWPLRKRLHLVRRGLVVGLVLLDLAMTAPVWFILDRISGYIGGDGWHRANLIDRFVRNFAEWWLAGMNIEGTGDWAATRMPWGGIDVTNYYVSIGLGGGLVSLSLFVWLIVVVFRNAGRALRLIRGSTDRDGAVATELLLWGAASAFCTHLVNLSSVTYWDQFYVVWYLHLAILVSMTQYAIQAPSTLAEGRAVEAARKIALDRMATGRR